MNATPPSILAEALERVELYSPFLRGLIERGGATANFIRSGALGQAVAQAACEGEKEDPAAALRLERSALALALGIGRI